MKSTGYILLTVAFLVGAYVSVLTEANLIHWPWFAPAFVVGVIGVGLARFGAYQESRQEGALTANIGTLKESLDSLVEKITRLDAEKESMHPNDVHGRIDELFPADLAAFVDARESIAHVHGLQAYANVMNEFAAGERYLNRVWSASVDCYIDDVHEYLGRAKEQFINAREVLAGL